MSKTLLIESWLEPDLDDRITVHDLFGGAIEALARIEGLEADNYKLREALEEMVTMYGGGGVTETHSAKIAALDKACKALGKKESE